MGSKDITYDRENMVLSMQITRDRKICLADLQGGKVIQEIAVIYSVFQQNEELLQKTAKFQAPFS